MWRSWQSIHFILSASSGRRTAYTPCLLHPCTPKTSFGPNHPRTCLVLKLSWKLRRTCTFQVTQPTYLDGFLPIPHAPHMFLSSSVPRVSPKDISQRGSNIQFFFRCGPPFSPLILAQMTVSADTMPYEIHRTYP